jgi:dTDP-4-dehydrorhamnose 3,5-epimerase
VPPGQAKYVTCVNGAVLDVVVDLRVGSPAFGQWEAVRLDDDSRHAVFLAEGLGHAFMALTDDAPRGVHPLDADLGIAWPEGTPPLLSPKDEEAPSLAEAERSGLLPSYAACSAYYEGLRDGNPGV